MKSHGSTVELQGILPILRLVEAIGTVGVAVECVDIYRNTKGEGRSLGHT